jgi:hypothetical protein
MPITRRANSSFSGLRSTAMIVAASASTAPWRTFKPTPPTPNTATELPGGTRAVLATAPTPVSTAQPMSAALSSGASAGSFTTERAGATTRSAIAPSAENDCSSRPWWRTRVDPSGMRNRRLIALPSAHRLGWPARQ